MTTDSKEFRLRALVVFNQREVPGVNRNRDPIRAAEALRLADCHVTTLPETYTHLYPDEEESEPGDAFLEVIRNSTRGEMFAHEAQINEIVKPFGGFIVQLEPLIHGDQISEPQPEGE
jgi:hypothetical protein